MERPPTVPESRASSQPAGKQVPAVGAGQQTGTAGRGGERNLALQWIDVALDPHRSARFVVTTAAGHGIEVTMEQLAYRRADTGAGQVSTPPIPMAPIATKGKLVALDTTTGETLEQPWTWISLGGGFSLWALIKRLIGLS